MSPILNPATHKTGVVVIIRKGEKYLLVKQNKEPYKNFWAPVHGTVELYETDKEAVVRETLEEVGILVRPIVKLKTSEADYKVKKLHWWLVEYLQGDIVIDLEEISEYGYFLLNEIISLNLFPQTRIFFNQLARRTL